MSSRVLVIYATRTGSTAEVAKVISAVLAERGFDVDVKPVTEKPSLEGYDAGILGSGIRMGGWLSEMLEFIRTNQAKLIQIPIAIFTVHLHNTGNDTASRAARKAYTVPVWKMLTPVDEAFFTGKMDPVKLSLRSRVLARMASSDTGPKVGDFRDWEKIGAWAATVLS